MSQSQWLCAWCVLLAAIIYTYPGFSRGAERVIHVSSQDVVAVDALPQKLREVRKAFPDDAIRVELAAGEYALSAPLHFDEECSGSEAAPVIISAAEGAEVRFCGGLSIEKWQPVRDPAVRARLTAAAAKHVKVADLRAAGVTNFGEWCSRGHEHELHPAPLEVLYRHRPTQLARWPNEGWATTRNSAARGSQTSFAADRFGGKRWQSLTDVWVHGYFEADWSDAWQPVAAADPQRGVLTITRSEEVAEVRNGARFCVLNVLEELDQPGEWYVDRTAGLLYFWSPDELKTGDVVVSNLDHLLTCYAANHVTFRGIEFECARVCLVEVAGGESVAFEQCTFRNAGNLGIHIAGGVKHSVRDCKMSDLGEGAIRVEGGDRRTLTPADHEINGNHIERFARTCHAGRPAIGVHGVGIRVSENCIHDGPDAAILLQGNEHIIEGNDIHHVCLETADAGAIYLGHDWTERGNVIRGNCIHHIGKFNRRDVMGIYLDDFASGTTVTGNVLCDAGRAIVIGGGRDNCVSGNVILGGFAAVQIDARGETWAKSHLTGPESPLHQRLQDMLGGDGLYLERYPALAQLQSSDPARPAGNQVTHNILCCAIGIDLHDRWTRQDVECLANFNWPVWQVLGPPAKQYTQTRSP